MKTFELEEYLFHYINDMGVSVLCMTDKKFDRKKSFAFLQDTKKAFLEYYKPEEITNAQAFSLKAFSDTIHDKVVSFTICNRHIKLCPFAFSLFFN